METQNAHNRYLHIPDLHAVVGLSTVLTNKKLSVYLVTVCVIIAPFYIFYGCSVALAVLLLKKTNRNEAEYIIIMTKVLFFVFKRDFQTNFREQDNLSRDKWPIPNVSFVWRICCNLYSDYKKFAMGMSYFIVLHDSQIKNYKQCVQKYPKE